jgi:hypothetical protein
MRSTEKLFEFVICFNFVEVYEETLWQPLVKMFDFIGNPAENGPAIWGSSTYRINIDAAYICLTAKVTGNLTFLKLFWVKKFN